MARDVDAQLAKVVTRLGQTVETVVSKSVAELPALLGHETIYAFAVYIDVDGYLDIDLCANTVEGRDQRKAKRDREYRDEIAEVQPIRLEDLNESERAKVETNAANWQESVESVLAMMNEKQQDRLDEIEWFYGLWDEFSVGEWKYNTLSTAFAAIDKITRKAMSRRNRIRISDEAFDAIGYERLKNELVTASNRVLLDFRQRGGFRELRATDDFIAFTTIHDNDCVADLEVMRAAWPTSDR